MKTKRVMSIAVCSDGTGSLVQPESNMMIPTYGERRPVCIADVLATIRAARKMGAPHTALVTTHGVTFDDNSRVNVRWAVEG